MADSKNPKVYASGNPFQKEKYRKLSEYNFSRGIKEFGKSKGTDAHEGEYYAHLLKLDDKEKNFLSPEIFAEVEERFLTKAGDINRVMTNTVASQACCFNIFSPLKKHKSISSNLFSKLMGKAIEVTEIKIEFTPEEDESLGDQGANQGTDADVAIFYLYEGWKRGVLLIEFKYIEGEFSYCGSYKSKSKRAHLHKICNSPEFFNDLVKSNLEGHGNLVNPMCGYLKYRNWQLTALSKAFNFESIVNGKNCPFRFSLQQLWRNMLLAERVCEVRKFQEFNFWVISPSENIYLWENSNERVESSFRNILSDFGNKVFRSITLEQFVDSVEQQILPQDIEGIIRKFKQRYL